MPMLKSSIRIATSESVAGPALSPACAPQKSNAAGKIAASIALTIIAFFAHCSFRRHPYCRINKNSSIAEDDGG